MEHLRRRIGVGLVAATIVAAGATVAVGISEGPVVDRAIRSAPVAPVRETRQELLIRINEPAGGEVMVPLRGDESAPPAAPRPGERAKPF